MLKNQLIFTDVHCVRHCSVTDFNFIKLLRDRLQCFLFTKEETIGPGLIICCKSDSWLIILQYWGKTLLSAKAPWIMRFSSHIAGGKRHYSQPCVSTDIGFLQSFQVIFLSLTWFSHLKSLTKISWIFYGTILKMSVEFFLYENSLLSSTLYLRTIAAALAPDSQLYLLDLECLLASTWVLPVSCNQKFFSGSKLGSNKTHLICFLLLRDQCPSQPDWQLLVRD